ncbi:Leucyl/phenylalanyl-tRNA--protein transferase [bacterium HR40]|nr:Leucyl/phenylalanyl-tRNA--protein transferase [bacterium HR40]
MLALPPELILSAYANGLFPMAKDRDDPTIHWLDPIRRGVIPLDRFHIPRSLKKTLRKRPFEIRIDHAFSEVVHACAEPTSDRPRTWLNDELIDAYVAMAERGFAHSVECWQEGRLVGGLYGVALGGAFFGESMFSRVRDASKVALVELVCRLRVGGFELLDTQFVTDHLRRFGAIEISRQDYRIRLRRAVIRRASWPRQPGSLAYSLFAGGGEGEEVAAAVRGSSQSTTQTS